jgi:hypothetical protein
VPPVSFSKIQLSAEGGSLSTYGRAYKFSIPQYGYLRNFVLRFTSNDLPITPAVIQALYTDLSSVAADSNNNLGTERTAVVSTANQGPNNQNFMYHAYVPYEENNNPVGTSNDPWAQMWLRVNGGESLTNGSLISTGPNVYTPGTVTSALGGSRVVPFRYDVRDQIINIGSMDNDRYSPFDRTREGPTYGYTSTSSILVSAPDTGSNNVMFRKWHAGRRIYNTWDWCSQSNLSKFLGAIIPEYVTLSTHNRPIQTVYGLQTLARINAMPTDKKQQYLGMLRPVLTSSPAQGNTATSYLTPTQQYATDRTWVCYFPCLFSFFEDTSLNLDTRFVETLEVNVNVRPQSSIFWAGDLGGNSGYTGSSTTFNQENLGHTGDLSYNFNTMRYRTMTPVVSSTILVEAIAYYHNFHDTTSQAIRDANFKPNVPANMLTYNTYYENPISLLKTNLYSGSSITMNLACNNLCFGLTFMVRRKANLTPVGAGNYGAEFTAFQDFTQTLPIASVTLTGSGQQLYQASGQECLLIDQWDYSLASTMNGSATTNTSGIYADNLASSHVQNKPQTDHIFAYRINFGFSHDRTYNSGAIALQTINNPTLTVQLLPLDGWVVNDDSLAIKNASFFNRQTQFGSYANQNILLNDNEFELVVFEDYWQMVRIDSNTGAITKSLDL